MSVRIAPQTATTLLLVASLIACSGSASHNDASDQTDATTPHQQPRAAPVSLASAALEDNAPRSISCHELIGGKPSPEPTIYELDGTGLYVRPPDGGKRLISSEGKLVPLGRSEGDEGAEESFAYHTVQGNVLTRTVLWQRVGEAPRIAFVERYNFMQQTVLDTDGTNSCYHHPLQDGRTQEHAEWEALSGTCDPQKQNC